MMNEERIGQYNLVTTITAIPYFLHPLRFLMLGNSAQVSLVRLSLKVHSEFLLVMDIVTLEFSLPTNQVGLHKLGLLDCSLAGTMAWFLCTMYGVQHGRDSPMPASIGSQ